MGDDILVDVVDIKTTESKQQQFEIAFPDYDSKPKRIEKNYTISWDISNNESTDCEKV